MNFVQVDPKDAEVLKGSKSAPVVYPILQGFLGTGFQVAKLDPDGLNRKPTSLYQGINRYLKGHGDLPVRAFMRSGDIFLERTDSGVPSAEALDEGAPAG